MPILPPPPKESNRRAGRALQHFLELRQDHDLLRQVPTELFEAKFIQSLPVFNLAISRRPIKNLARQAKRMSWMYFVQYQSAIAALEVGMENGRHRHTRFLQGASMGQLLDSVRVLRRRRAAYVKQSHMRLLRIYALHFSCVWLHGEKDILVPLQELPGRLVTDTEYESAEFLDAVYQASKSVLDLEAKAAPKLKLPKPPATPKGGKSR